MERESENAGTESGESAGENGKVGGVGKDESVVQRAIPNKVGIAWRDVGIADLPGSG